MTADDDLEPTQMTLERWTVTYYPCSGGIVIGTRREVLDAGLIGTPGPITREGLRRVARTWVTWRKDYEIKSHNRPADTLTHNRPAKGVPAT